MTFNEAILSHFSTDFLISFGIYSFLNGKRIKILIPLYKLYKAWITVKKIIYLYEYIKNKSKEVDHDAVSPWYYSTSCLL